MDFFTLVGLITCIYFIIYCILLWVFDCDLQLAFAEKFGKKLVKLRSKVVWITCASTELGKMMALKTAEQHGKLVLSSKMVEELKKIKDLCLKINPCIREKDILILEFDVEDLRGHRWALEEVIGYFGKLDVLILNEDKWEKGGWEYAQSAMDRRLFQANVFGVLSMSRLVIKYFNIKKKGKLAVTSSVAALIGIPYSGCYTSTKYALHGYFNSLRFEKLEENILVTLLCHGSSELSRKKGSSNSELTGSERKTKKLGRGKKMTAERCAHLCLTAIVNDLDEVWMAAFPILFLIYGIKYYPNVTKLVLKYLRLKGV